MIGAATNQNPQPLPLPPPPPPPQQQQQAAPASRIRLPDSVYNAFRVGAVFQRLSNYLSSADKGSGLSASRGAPMEFLNSCLCLARGIDYAVANDEVLPKAHELPALLKTLCTLKDDCFYLAIIMVLMISVKNACKSKWFSEKDCQELLALADEIEKNFQSPRDTAVRSTASSQLVSSIMARFYPQLKMGEVLTTVEVEPGYAALLNDFRISKSVVHSPKEKIRLFVARTDNMETSQCIVTPPQVSFLLNGKGVERRTNTFVDPGPQMPTNVTQMLKYGTNLLQAVGQFNGHYVISIAFMSGASPPDSSTLLDYVPATIAAADSDSDIIEVASRISLNCPISRTRIQLPVKGHSCKHHQCFDYRNFLSINSNKPSWRCPHCNQPVCFTDIRVDQNIVKVLQEVGDDISEVTITADGSWKAVMECDDDLYKTPNETLTRLKQGSEQQKCSVSPTVISNVLDLTGDDDDDMDGAFTSEPQDRKPLQSDFMIQSIPTNASMPSTLNSGSTVTQLAQLGNNWPGFVQTPSTSNAGQEMQTHGGLPQLMSTIVTSAMAGVVPPAPAQDAQFLGNANFIDSMMQTHLSFPNNRHIQQSPVVNTAVGSEYGNMPSIPRHGTRAPAGMPALPARTQTPTQWQPWSMMPSGPSRAPQPTMSTTQPLDGFGSIGMQVERQQQISRPPVNTLQVSSIPPSALIRSSSMQDRSFSTGQSSQRPVVRPSPGQLHGRSRTSSGLFQSFQNHHLQQPMNPVTSPSPTHSPSMARPILPCTPAPVSQTPGSSRLWLPAQQPAMPAQTPVQSQKQPSRVTAILRDSMRASAGDQRANTGVHASSGGDGAGDLSAEQSWRPTRPMRGSITGRPHLDNNLNVIRPTQQAQATPPPSAMGVASPTVAPQLRAPNPIISSRSHLGYPRGTQ